MNETLFYREQLEELLHFLRTHLTTLRYASFTLRELFDSNKLAFQTFDPSNESSEFLSHIQDSFNTINKKVSDIDEKITALNNKG